METAAEGNAGWWQGGAYEVAMVAGWGVHKTRGRGRGFGMTRETKPLWLGFGRLVANGGGG